MRVLLFAYEFPPVLAAQALRWYYLSNELARLGVGVDVLAPALPNHWGFNPVLEASVKVHRCYPGPFIALSSLGAARLRAPVGVDGTAAMGCPPEGPGSPALVRAYRRVRRVLDHVVFPDVRSEWLPFAWRAARRLHATRRYDLVISSHEPGVDLLLGLRAQRAWRLPWIADLADPLLAPYTPRWRNRLDLLLERRVCRRANGIVVTTEAVAKTLAKRHTLPQDRFTLIRQGFNQDWQAAPDHRLPDGWPTDGFVALFTGTFYAGFRTPGALIRALQMLSDLRVVLVGDTGPFAQDLRALGDRVRLLGKQPHDTCLALQRRADVLINLGNRDDDQVPGKIYEYFGAGRPVLHLAASPTDPVPALLRRLRRGIAVPNESGHIAAALAGLRDQWRAGSLDDAFDLSGEGVAAFSWQAQAVCLYALLRRHCAHTPQAR